MFKPSDKEIQALMAKHTDLLPILTNPFKSAEKRLNEFCIAYLTKLGYTVTKNQEK